MLPCVVVVDLPITEAPGLAGGVCERCAAAALWPEPGWRDRLADRVLPVFRDLLGDDGLVFVEPAALAAAGTA